MTKIEHKHMRSLIQKSALRRFSFVLLAGLTLSACGNIKQQLGFNRESPDEFTVLSRAPLTIPPDFALQPPEPGAVRPQEGTDRDRARQVLLGRTAQNPKVYARQLATNNTLTAGEKTLLMQSGANEAEPNIRHLVEQETSTLAMEKASFTDHIVFWEDRSYQGTAVDANKESRRIQENMALGRALSEGEAPTIKRETRALFEGIF